MNYTQVKKLASELGLEIENDLKFIYDRWHIEINAPQGKSFGGCQYHTAVFWLNADESEKKTNLWFVVAKFMADEATELGDCHCGHWDKE
jgi:hypothetical protein